MKGVASDHHHVNTGQINGGGGIDRNSNPVTRVGHHKQSAPPSGPHSDSASISDNGRDTLSAAKGLAASPRHPIETPVEEAKDDGVVRAPARTGEGVPG